MHDVHIQPYIDAAMRCACMDIGHVYGGVDIEWRVNEHDVLMCVSDVEHVMCRVEVLIEHVMRHGTSVVMTHVSYEKSLDHGMCQVQVHVCRGGDHATSVAHVIDPVSVSRSVMYVVLSLCVYVWLYVVDGSVP